MLENFSGWSEEALPLLKAVLSSDRLVLKQLKEFNKGKGRSKIYVFSEYSLNI